MTDPLSTWKDGAVKDAILGFVDRACTDGSPDPSRSRSGSRSSTTTAPCGARSRCRSSSTSSCAGWPRWPSRPDLRDRQPWKAAHERDYGWLAQVMAEHYAGDDTNVRTLAAGVVAAFANITVDEFEAAAAPSCAAPAIPRWAAATSSAPTHPWSSSSRYLRANGFANYIASGGGRDFMRPISDEVYGIPREAGHRQRRGARLHARTSTGGAITRQAAADYLDDGPEKPVRIWTRTGRRPVLAAGNSNGDIEMLEFTQHPDKPTLRLLVLHDDAEREFDYVVRRRAGARARRRQRLDRRQHQERLGRGLLKMSTQVVSRRPAR